MKEKIVAENKNHLKDLIKQEIQANGLNCDLNHIVVSQITDMSFLFEQSKFNGDISNWDTSNVLDMNYLFSYAKFNGDISKWNVEKVEQMYRIFEWSDFFQEQHLNHWKPYALNIAGVFEHCYLGTPYWANYTDKDSRKSMIDNYHLHLKLNDKLPLKNILSKHKKI